MKKILNLIQGLLIIFLVQYFCIYILKFLKIAFPAPILGIIVLFILLELKIIKENWIKDFCELILKYMILFFIPLFAGIVSYSDLVKKNFIPISLTLLITTVLIMAIVALSIEYGIKYQRLYRMKRNRR